MTSPSRTILICLPLVLVSILLIASIAWAASVGRLDGPGFALAASGLAALGVSIALRGPLDPRSAPAIRSLADQVDRLSRTIEVASPADASAADSLSEAVGRLMSRVSSARDEGSSILDASLLDSRFTPPPPPRPTPIPALTRSGLFDSAPRFDGGEGDPMISREFSTLSTTDMIARLAPETFRWVDSTPAEQVFLGRSLVELRSTSFLEIVHPDHRELAREQLRAAMIKGEGHGLIYRIKTAKGEAKAIEMNVSVRYALDHTIDHLRCHITDVTDRLRASKELRRRTRDLISANESLMRANRELQELKDLYSDLYQNAPAMYFSLDTSGTIRECNNTLLETLGFSRKDLVGRPYVSILPDWRKPSFAAHFARFLATGHVEVETRWVKADGEIIDVWVKGTGVFGPDGQIVRSRSVAQDVTARKMLEAQLQEKNARLARANEELSLKHKELDEFSHVVAHDLQEPLRTLIAFSDFLMRDHGEKLGDEGREQVKFLVDASRRMRSLILDLLELSRAGKAAGQFGPVDLNGVLAQIRADFAATIAEKKATVRAEGELPTIWGDRNRLAQLLANLVGNALKYNLGEIPPEVLISATIGPKGEASISVADNGIGIDPKFHSKIFGLFRRLHTREEFEGTGAGLAICQKIVHAHGGEIEVDSAVGRGATFTVKLPGPPAGGVGHER